MRTATRAEGGRRHGYARILFVLAALLFLAAGFATLPVRAPPPIPMTTQGDAYGRTGSPLPVGTPIQTFIDGVDYSNRSVVQNAAGSYSVVTAGNLLINSTTPEPSPTKMGANSGEPVQYVAGDLTTSADVFQEVLPWHSDVVATRDLHLGASATTPQPLKIQGLVTQPAQGGNQYIFLCNPTPSPVSLADYYLQVDAPGTYYGGNLSLGGTIRTNAPIQENLTAAFTLVSTGDALKLVYRNPGGPGASAGGADVVIDRVEFNATVGGTLDWQPGATSLGSAPAPGPGQILERSPTCADTNSPSDFHLAPEPGLPAILPPTVTILAPSAGQTITGGQAFTVRWAMQDNAFVSAYLLVWVNVTYQGTTTTLLSAATGATSVSWSVPDGSGPGTKIEVEVANPVGQKGNATASFDVVPSTPYSVYIAIVLVLVVAGFMVLAFLHARREAMPPQPPSPPAAVPGSPGSSTPGGRLTPKTCPRCQGVVQSTEVTCAHCGYAFSEPRI